MDTFKKQSDLGFSDANSGAFDLGPMNEHNEFTMYVGPGIWNKEREGVPYCGMPGFEGYPDAKAPRNQEIYGPTGPDYPMNKLDQHKENVLPEEGKKVFQEDDIEDLEEISASEDFKLKKKSEVGKDYFNDETPMFYDFKGQGTTPEPLGGNDGGVAPQNAHTNQNSPVWPEGVPPIQVSPDNVPGMAQNDTAVANPTALKEKASVTPSVKGKGVTNKVTNTVSNDLKDGSTGFSGTRGTSGSRGTKSARAELCGFVFTKTAASPASMADTFTGSARRNDQSPWWNEGTNLTSYSPEELKRIKQSNDFKYSGPITTSSPSSFFDRLYCTDTKNIARGLEGFTWDFLNFPVDQKLDEDALSDEEKKEAKKDGANI